MFVWLFLITIVFKTPSHFFLLITVFKMGINIISFFIFLCQTY